MHLESNSNNLIRYEMHSQRQPNEEYIGPNNPLIPLLALTLAYYALVEVYLGLVIYNSILTDFKFFEFYMTIPPV